MTKRGFFKAGGVVWLVVLLLVQPSHLYAGSLDRYFEEEPNGSEAPVTTSVRDPLEPVNRVFFNFNDKLYFWVLKPVSTGYAAVMPEDVRIVFRNAFNNLLSPIRVVNNILQGKLWEGGIELTRFVINSTFGIAGLTDTAGKDFGLEQREEDLGQTLAVYGAGDGFFICWPFLGPSNVRDTFGLIGDGFLNPINYAGGSVYSVLGIRAGEKINDTSLRLGDYERFKEAAIDPYISMRQAYQQYRENQILDRSTGRQDTEAWQSGNTNSR